MTELGNFKFTPPRHISWKSCGVIGEDEARAFLDQTIAAVHDLPYFFLTIDITEFTADTPESRKYAVEVFRKLPPRAVALVGGSFGRRTIAKLLFKAISVLPGGWRQHTRCFKSGDEVEPWFESLTEKLEAAGERHKSNTSSD